MLAQGESLEVIATARGVKLDTVRTQLRTLYKKTGTHRQGELVCLAGALDSARLRILQMGNARMIRGFYTDILCAIPKLATNAISPEGLT